jgi:autotransporter strand-loop-strand O-heptosyltransferase
MMPLININYCYGCNVKITCPENKTYKVVIKDTEKILLTKNTTNGVVRLGRVYGENFAYIKNVNTYYIEYSVDIYFEDDLIYTETINLNNKNVKVVIESNALGDNIAWIEQISRFQEINNCNVFVFCLFKSLFEKVYTNLTFNDIESNNNKFVGLPCYDFECLNEFCSCYYASYNIGFSVAYSFTKNTNPTDPRKETLSKVASDILGIEYKEIRPKIFIENKKSNFNKKYVCIATHSTSLMKYWMNTEGWTKVCDFLQEKGYEVICIDKEHTIDNDGVIMTIPSNCIDKTGNLPLQDRITDLLNCEFFIGLGSGLSWLAWSLNKKVILISGFSAPYSEFYTTYRVINYDVCNSCWNEGNLFLLKDEQFKYRRSLCPKSKDFECSRSITADMVIEKIDSIINERR